LGKAKTAGIGISLLLIFGIIGFLFLNGVIQINQKNLSDSIQNIPQNIQDTSKTAKTIVTETADKVIPEPAKKAVTDTTDKIQSTISEKIDTITKSTSTQEPDSNPEPVIKKSDRELVQFALEKINQDRAKNNLTPVILSRNTAAQTHAEDVLSQRAISHWMTNGEKPYMTYSRLGGTGSVSQNVGFSGFVSLEECASPNVICKKIDPIKSIEESEYNMMYDDADSDWGHRDNILRNYHTHVSLGIAYDDYTFAFVENFEDNYLTSNSPIRVTGDHVIIDSVLKSGKIQNIGVFYDPLPTHELYLQHHGDTSYGMGENVAVIAPPLPPNSYYDQPSDYDLIVANNWKDNGSFVLIDFDLSSVFTKPGVYTVGVWLDDNGDNFLVTSYSIFYKG